VAPSTASPKDGKTLLSRESGHDIQSSHGLEQSGAAPRDIRFAKGWPPREGRGMHFWLEGRLVNTSAVDSIITITEEG
jgi:hypothetical protein